MPDFDFDAFNHDTPLAEGEDIEAGEIEEVDAVTDPEVNADSTPSAVAQNNGADEEVDKW
jgi:hypothetical protein